MKAAPAVGINEDPVTGSAQCYLASYWSDKLSKQELISFQASKRTGIVQSRIASDKVIISGKAITVFRIERHF